MLYMYDAAAQLETSSVVATSSFHVTNPNTVQRTSAHFNVHASQLLQSLRHPISTLHYYTVQPFIMMQWQHEQLNKLFQGRDSLTSSETEVMTPRAVNQPSVHTET